MYFWRIDLLHLIQSIVKFNQNCTYNQHQIQFEMHSID